MVDHSKRESYSRVYQLVMGEPLKQGGTWLTGQGSGTITTLSLEPCSSNLDKLFPCANRNRIFCRRFTSEEDGFFKGRSIIEAADHGNNFRMFGRANVYGMTFQGCRYLSGHKGCLPRYFETIIACFLPRCCAGY